MTRMHAKIHGLGWIGLSALILVLAGCATAPPPIQLMDRAQTEIRAARAAGAQKDAPDALAQAERRLAAAQSFTANNKNGEATDSAAEAEAAAATARARAEAAHLKRQIQEKIALNQRLEADLKRRQAVAAAAQRAVMAPAPAATVEPAAAASAAGTAPVTLPSIQLGPPAIPAAAGSAGTPAPASTVGGPGAGGRP